MLEETTRHQVTFIRANGEVLAMRLFDATVNTLVGTGRALKVRYFITVDGEDQAQHLPIWGVFDMATVDQPMPGEYSLRDPIFTVTAEKPDAAIMFALMRNGRR